MTAVTGPGPWPGVDALEAQNVVLGELGSPPEGVTGMPFAVVLTQRGPWSDLLGRAVGMLVDLPVELGPHGWRLTGRPGGDLVRSRSYLRDDVDALAVAAHGWSGPLVVPVCGPVTTAASVDLSRGERVLSDPGASRDVAESLAAGVVDHLASLRRAVPGARPTLLLHEPALAAAIEARVPTFSGRATLRAVPVQVAGERIAAVAAAARAAGAGDVVVHTGSSLVGLPAAIAAGADGVAVEIKDLPAAGWEQLAGAVEAGTALWAQLAPAPRASGGAADLAAHAQQLLQPWSRIGLATAQLEGVVLLAAVADGAPSARSGLAEAVQAAQRVADRAAG
ncbi:hypothetical protein [Cellulomonas sp. NTE-D12]|uniref:hypothetical protein n=1 Tax=Cellulomonas sp. NTE-D12 TaxID=2962632 RepID=UPI003081E1B3|nr:hypothetical protein CELD12_10510 [Cellulomonas sp. NTE-D12]